MYRGGLISIEDMSTEEIVDVLELAREMAEDIRGHSTVAQGLIMASLFFEPSTRTRGSFESAMNRLGGRVISTVGSGSSSMEKGETLVDTIRIWSKYSDVITIRHPWEGSARLAADYASVPVINGGDGGHEHPTQTLCDLFTLVAEKGSLEGLRVALCGDLKHGRTVHSLIFGLLRFGAELFFVPGEGLGLPEHVRAKIQIQYGRQIERVPPGDFEALYGGSGLEGNGESSLDAIYMTPSRPHQRTLLEDEPNFRLQISPGSELVFYVTRKQVERDAGLKEEGKAGGRYPRITRDTMRSRFARSIVLHPLPRVDEISYDMDEDHRSRYFVQAGYGVPVRMALLSLALGLRPWKKAEGQDDGTDSEDGTVRAQGVECQNGTCVVNQEPQGCEPGFSVMQGEEGDLTFACKYCGWHNAPAFYGVQQSGQLIYKPIGRLRFISQHQLHQFRFFADEEEARTQRYGLSVREPEGSGRVYEVTE